MRLVAKGTRPNFRYFEPRLIQSCFSWARQRNFGFSLGGINLNTLHEALHRWKGGWDGTANDSVDTPELQSTDRVVVVVVENMIYVVDP